MLAHSLKQLLDINLNEGGLERLSWRDFGNGLSMARLARSGASELLIYRIAENAAADAFRNHEHTGGEFYFVLKGKIADETGVYEAGDIVFLDRESRHTPRAMGETIVLVLWPEGVRVIET